ncbi:hypothetical protein GXP76_01510 [Streptomyces sp. NP-1717]|nr:hypothetical protein [Streptomyces sp. NP-1717]
MVEVIADLGPVGFRYGSGCVVAGKTVLTAAHVIFDAVGVTIRDTHKRSYPAQVDAEFVGSPEGPAPDFALLQVDDLPGDGYPPLALGRAVRDSQTPVVIERCHAFGYPGFAETSEPRPARDSVHAVGVIAPLSKLSRGLLSMVVSLEPATLGPQSASARSGESPWSGMSGGPVVADERLLGMVVEHALAEGASTVTVLPLTALEADPDRPRWGPGVPHPAAWWRRLGAVDGPAHLQPVPAPSATHAADAPPPSAAPVTPPPRPSLAHAFVSRALVFAGAEHVTKKDLAATIRKHWAIAADRFFRRMGTESYPSESWAELRSWLRQFNDHRTDDVEGRIVLIDTYLTDPRLSHDHKLLRLLHWLDPDGPVVYRGRPITYGSLAQICLRRYVGGGRRDAELLEELARPHGRLLDTLAEFPTLDRLRGVRRSWHKALKKWRDADSTLWPPEVRDWAADVGPGALLAARLPPGHLAEIRPRLPAEAQPPDPSSAWYDHLLQAAGGRDTVLGRLAEAEWSAQARQEALTTAREREQRLRQERAAEQRRQTEERQRRERLRLAAEEEGERQRRVQLELEQRRLRRAEDEEGERQRETEWQAAETARLSAAIRALAVLRAFALGALWALFLIVAIWLSWWFTSYEFDAAQILSWLACIFSASALYRVVPCALRLGGAFRPRLRTPSTWLPPTRPALATAALLLVYGLIGGDSSSRSDSVKADSDLLRDRGLGAFLNYVSQNGSRSSFGDILIGLLALVVGAGCVWFGQHAGRTAARRWKETHAQQDAHRLTGPR